METARDGNYLGLLYVKMGKFPEAEALFKRNLEMIGSAPLSEYKPYNLSYVYYGLGKLYYYWGQRANDEVKFQQAVGQAAFGLSQGRFLIPGELTRKFKGCTHRELGEWGDAIACLKASYTALEGSGVRNLGVIGASARLELAKLYLMRGQGGDLEVARTEIEAALTALKGFDIPSAQAYFGESMRTLRAVIEQLKSGSTAGVLTHIQAVIDKIPY